MKDRPGRFAISAETIGRKPESVLGIMGKCVVVRAEMIYCSDEIEYTALCDLFDKVKTGYVTPEYEWTEKDGEWSVKRK